MKYERITSGVFLSRPNRFTALVKINGEVQTCHVKNTGRCKELLVNGAHVILQENSAPHRKTKYDLISVYKGDMLVNMDSQIPNRVFGEYLPRMFKDITLIRPETVYGSSRLDFYIEADGRRIFAEVKGVTLEERGRALFPDAPTQRGIKHIRELMHAKEEGFDAYIVFIIQMPGIKSFSPNDKTHPQFGQVLRLARDAGVEIIALCCNVTEDEITPDNMVNIIL